MLNKMAKITIQTVNNLISFDVDINFSTVEMPYQSIGYRNNGTSTASIVDLESYWTIVDNFFLLNNISTTDYVTLESILIENERFGV